MADAAQPRLRKPRPAHCSSPRRARNKPWEPQREAVALQPRAVRNRMRSARRKALLRCSVPGSRTPAPLQYKPRQGPRRRIERRHLQHHRSKCHHSEGKRSVTHPTHSERETSPCSNDTEWMCIGNSAGEAYLIVSGCGKDLRVSSVSSNLARSFSDVNHFLTINFAILGREEST